MSIITPKTKLRQRISELEEAERYFRTLYEATIDAVLLIDPDIGIFDCNPAAIAMFRAPHKGALCGLAPSDLSASCQLGHIPSATLAMQYIGEALEYGNKEFEWLARRLNGEEFPVQAHLFAISLDGELQLLQCILRDITEYKQREREALRIRKELECANRELQEALEQLQQAASIDYLTSAWNRRFFNRVINTERARAARSGLPLTLILIDIDYFKAINDTYGHLVGDQVLIEVAKTLQQSLRAGDYLFRWGGEEFAVLAPELDENEGLMLAERLREQIALQSFTEEIHITISAGIAQLCPEDILTKWVARADDALYTAKNSGRNQVAVGKYTSN